MVLEAFIFITISIVISSLLLYRKNRLKAELLSVLLLFPIIFLIVAIAFLPFYPNRILFPIIIFYTVVFIILFLGVGRKRPIQTWREIFKEYRKYLFGDEFKLESKMDIAQFFLVLYKKSKENFYITILGPLIATLLIVIWILWVR